MTLYHPSLRFPTLGGLGIIAACSHTTRQPLASIETAYDQPPRFLDCTRPGQPAGFKSLHKDSVVTRFLVDTTGTPVAGSIRVIQSTDASLDPYALLFIRSCHFSPARKAGQPIAVAIQEVVRF